MMLTQDRADTYNSCEDVMKILLKSGKMRCGNEKASGSFDSRENAAPTHSCCQRKRLK